MKRLHCPHCLKPIDIRSEVATENKHSLTIKVHVRSHHKPKAKPK